MNNSPCHTPVSLGVLQTSVMDVKVEEDALASEDAVTRCRCLRNEDQEGFMIECDTCHV